MKSFDVNSVNNGTRNLASLYDGVFITERMGQREDHWFITGLCKQKDGAAMGSPLGPTLANVFLCHFKGQWMSDCSIDYKPISYRRYVDNTFLLFSSEFIWM